MRSNEQRILGITQGVKNRGIKFNLGMVERKHSCKKGNNDRVEDKQNTYRQGPHIIMQLRKTNVKKCCLFIVL